MSKKTDPVDGGGLALFARLFAVCLAIMLFADKSASLGELSFVVGDARANVLLIVAFWTELLGPGFYICALWASGNVFARINRGEAFDATLVRGMREVGTNLIIGALAPLAITPLFGGMLAALSIAPTAAVYASLDLPPSELEAYIVNLAFFFIGAAFFQLARKGASLKSELEQFV